MVSRPNEYDVRESANNFFTEKNVTLAAVKELTSVSKIQGQNFILCLGKVSLSNTI